VLKDGRYEFKGSVSEPIQAMLWTDQNNSIDFYLDPADIQLSSMSSLYGSVVHGGPTELEHQVYRKMMEPLDKRRAQLFLRKDANKDNEDSVLAIARENAVLNKESERKQVEFVSRFPESYYSNELMESHSFLIDPEVLEPMLRALSPKFKQSAAMEDIRRRLDIAKNTWIGKPALEFTQAGPDGKPVSLKSFRGKYVMIDFWASWCGWCRIEHPMLIKAYNKYKSKGFTLLSVSLDDEKGKQKWLEAIKKDGLPWQQVSDLKGRDNEVAKLYGIKGIPQSVLVGPDGMILGKNLRGDALLVKLHELFGE
jgi:peroxiredoxin